MREIKFRAYDYKLKKFTTDFCLESNGLMFYPGITGYMNDLYLNQYMGLKDKNGKEIYEDDIVEYWEGSTELVTWNNNGFWSGWGVLQHSRIIGNIYENHELLEEK